MRISFRLMLGFFAGAALVALVGLGSHWANSQVHSQLERLTHSSINAVNATDMVVALDEAEQAFRAWQLARQANASPDQIAPTPSADPTLAADQPHSLAELADAVDEALLKFQRSLDSARLSYTALMRTADPAGKSQSSMFHRDQLRAAFRDLRTDFETYSRARREALEPALAAESDESASDAPTDRKPESDLSLEPLVARLRERVIAEKQRAEGEFTGEVRGAERSLAAADARNVQWTLLALGLALALAIWLNRSIGRPLERLRRAAVSLGAGRLDTRTGIRRNDEFGILAQTFDQMAADLEAKTVSKAYLDNILGSMSEMVFVTSRNWVIQRVNGAVLTELGSAEPDLLGLPLPSLFIGWPEAADRPSLLGHQALHLQAADGRLIPVLFTAAELRDAAGHPTGYVASAVNISDRLQTEIQLQASLEEKEVLLREVHHRVKNNLQIICSLLSLQAREASDPRTAQMFAESQTRIRSMALIHEQLYRSNQFASIDFAPYAQQLCENLLRSAVPDERIVLRLIVDAPPLTLDQAVPCGMMLNELVSNALKHAYPDGQPGEIRVEFTAAGCQRRLVVSDNGVGLPPQQVAGPSSLGLTVVAALVRQLGGDLSIRGDGGARFVITFPAGDPPSSAGSPSPAETPVASEPWTQNQPTSPAITASKS